MKNLSDDIEELDKAFKDFFYQAAKAVGIIFIIKKILKLELKEWVKERNEKR